MVPCVSRAMMERWWASAPLLRPRFVLNIGQNCHQGAEERLRGAKFWWKSIWSPHLSKAYILRSIGPKQGILHKFCWRSIMRGCFGERENRRIERADRMLRLSVSGKLNTSFLPCLRIGTFRQFWYLCHFQGCSGELVVPCNPDFRKRPLEKEVAKYAIEHSAIFGL